MLPPEITSRLNELDSYIAKIAALPDGDEVKRYLCRFGTVLICGNVEQAVQIIILTRLKAKAHARVLSFVKSHFQRGHNLDCEAIQRLLIRFDAGWYDAFATFVDRNDDVKEGVASCYAVRNSTAHGGGQSLSFRRLQELNDVHKRLIVGVNEATSVWANR